MHRRGLLLWVATVLALLAVTVVLFLTSPVEDEFGWFAYTPGSDGFEGSSHVVILTGKRAAAYGVLGLTLVVLAAGLGYTLGRRRRERD